MEAMINGGTVQYVSLIGRIRRLFKPGAVKKSEVYYDIPSDPDVIASDAYSYADAMIRERESRYFTNNEE
ncbi:MAG: hypothetical protein SNH18_10365 [Rikenellaceae bacterium]